MQLAFNKSYLLYWVELKTQKHMKYTDSLRNKLQKHIEDADTSWYQVSKVTKLSHQLLYAFRNDGGITFDNAVRLMEYLNIEIKDLK